MGIQRSLRVGTLLLLGSAMFLLSGQNAQADTIYACVAKSNGAVRIVTATTVCDPKKETPLSWSSTGTAGPPGPGQLKVVDANGQFVGFVNGLDAVARVFGTEWNTFSVNALGLSNSGAGLYYASTDCTGPAYFPYDANLPSQAESTGTTSNGTFYYSFGSVVPSVTFASILVLNPDGTSGGCSSSGGTNDVRQVSTTSLSVVPPLRITQ